MLDFSSDEVKWNSVNLLNYFLFIPARNDTSCMKQIFAILHQRNCKPSEMFLLCIRTLSFKNFNLPGYPREKETITCSEHICYPQEESQSHFQKNSVALIPWREVQSFSFCYMELWIIIFIYCNEGELYQCRIFLSVHIRSLQTCSVVTLGTL